MGSEIWQYSSGTRQSRARLMLSSWMPSGWMGKRETAMSPTSALFSTRTEECSSPRKGVYICLRWTAAMPMLRRRLKYCTRMRRGRGSYWISGTASCWIGTCGTIRPSPACSTISCPTRGTRCFPSSIKAPYRQEGIPVRSALA